VAITPELEFMTGLPVFGDLQRRHYFRAETSVNDINYMFMGYVKII